MGNNGFRRMVSVVTAAHRPDPEHVAAAHRSLAGQVMPPGWRWEWVLQGDADELGGLPGAVRADPRVSIGSNARRGGPGVARTTALARSRGVLIRNLDVDDMLAEGALADAIEVFTAHPEVRWMTCALVDLLPDGTTRGFDREPPSGATCRGELTAAWCADPRSQRVHPSTLTVWRPLLTALGGWMALPVSEDQGLLLAADSVSTGWHSARVGLIRRHHGGQMTRSATFGAEVTALRELISERACALAKWDVPS